MVGGGAEVGWCLWGVQLVIVGRVVGSGGEGAGAKVVEWYNRDRDSEEGRWWSEESSGEVVGRWRRGRVVYCQELILAIVVFPSQRIIMYNEWAYY